MDRSSASARSSVGASGHSIIGAFVSSPSSSSVGSSSTSSGFTSDASERSATSGDSLFERRARRRAEKEQKELSNVRQSHQPVILPPQHNVGIQHHQRQQLQQKQEQQQQQHHHSHQPQVHHHQVHHSQSDRDQDRMTLHHYIHTHHHPHHPIHPHHPSLGEIAAMNRSAHELRHHDDCFNPAPTGRPPIGSCSGSYVTSGSPGSYMACGPAPHHAMAHLSISPKPRKRTTSLKKPHRKPFENTELDDMRPRTSSLPTRNNIRKPNLQYLSPPPFPSSLVSDDVYTIRSFVTTSKGQLVNRGDSFRSRSTNSVMSSNSGSFTELTHLSNASSQCSLSQGSGGGNSCGPESPGPAAGPPFRVLMLGSPGVGKSSLTEQFSTSEYLGTFGTSIDSYREKSVSLLIDGEESAVDFIDPVDENDAINDLSMDGFVVVFRIDDRRTFQHATDLLYDLRKARGVDSAVILAANKCDLVRSREVSSDEAKSVAATYDCKYVETSVVLNHNVDELLVGIVTQVRLLAKKGGRRTKHAHAGDDTSCYARSKHLLNKIFRKYPISKSCENLYVL